MKIRVNLQIFLIIIVFILTRQIKTYSYIMLFALIHELGHIIAGLLLKLKVKIIEIMPFGISVNFEAYGYGKLIENKKVLIALAGPSINFLIALIIGFSNTNIEVKHTIIYSNLLLGFFNLIPIYPLDGGRILKSVLRLKCKDIHKANEISNKISNAQIIIITALRKYFNIILQKHSYIFCIAIFRINSN